jgi:trk system potassium uptake protein TrkH
MQFAVVQRILGLIVMAFSTTMLPPIVVAAIYADGHATPFAVAFVLVLLVGFLLWWPVRRVDRDLRLRDGFLVVALFWGVLGLAGAIPLLLNDAPVLSYVDAVFEAVSGFTTTGATVITGLESLPRSMLWYRQQIQWIGGVGIIVLAVALFPMLGIGGMQIYKSETPGPVKEEKLTPRMMQTAKALGFVYLLLTAACAVGYYFAGMDGFDALGHAFSTVSTGGFSTHDARLAYFNSSGVDFVATVFMFFGGVNFATHFVAWRTKEWRTYWGDPQFRAYFVLCAALVAFATIYLYASRTYPSLSESFRHGALQVVSMQSTTGFRSADFAFWPGALPALLMLVTFVGGCAGSTAGGMKVIRWQLVVKQGVNELKRLVYPSAILPVKFAERTVPGNVLAAVTGYFAIYLIIFGVTMLVLMATGLDQVTAWSAVATSMNNAGPGLGAVAVTFRDTPDAAKWVCIVAMLIGRLEVFTLIVLFTPSFWRK